MYSTTTVRIVPSDRAIRILVTDITGNEVLKARLPPAPQMHRTAARAFLESIALFYNERIRVVLSADDEATLSALGLLDGLGVTIDTFYYQVEFGAPAERRSRTLRGVGDFRDVRRLTVLQGGKP